MSSDGVKYGSAVIVASVVLIVATFVIDIIYEIFILPFCCFAALLLVLGIVIVVVEGVRSLNRPPAGRTWDYQEPLAFCPVCGNRLTWVYEYHRWYCNRCQMYV